MYNNKNKWHVLLKFIAKIHMKDQLRDFMLIEFELYYLLFDIPFMLIFLFRHTTVPIIRRYDPRLSLSACSYLQYTWATNAAKLRDVSTWNCVICLLIQHLYIYHYRISITNHDWASNISLLGKSRFPDVGKDYLKA